MKFFSNPRPGIVVENVHGAELLQGGSHHPVAIFLFRHVDFGEYCLPAVLLDEFVDSRLDGLLDIAANNFCSLARKQARGGAADAAVRPGDNRYFSLQPAESLPKSWVFCVCHSYRLLIFERTLAQLGRKFQAEDERLKIEDGKGDAD